MKLLLKISIVSFSFLIFLSACKTDYEIKVTDGFIDLSEQNPENKIIDLKGEWEFHYNKLLEPGDFKTGNPDSRELIAVPGGWHEKNKNQSGKPEYGFATYRLRIKVPDKNKEYKFLFSSIFSSAKVWINDSLCFESGKVADKPDNAEASFLKNTYVEHQNYNLTSDTIELIVQVADFSKGGYYSGIKQSVKFGTAHAIYQNLSFKTGKHAMLLGVLALIALVYIFTFFYNRKVKSNLVFAILTGVVIMRTLYTTRLLSNFFSFDAFNIFGFLPVDLYPALMALFFFLIYRKEFPLKAIKIILIIASLWIPLILFSTPNLIARLEPIIIIYIFGIFLYLLGYVLLKAVIKRRQGAILSFIGVVILLLFNLHDFLFSAGIILGFGSYISEYGFGLYIILQSLNLAEINTLMLKNNIKLNESLDYQNKNLEKIVTERTQEIRQQSEEIKAQNEEILHQNETLNQKNEEIEAQKDEIEKQRDIARKQNDEIISSINYAKRIQDAVLPSEKLLQEILPEHFVLFKPRDIVSGDFYWMKQIKNFIVVAAADCTGHGVPGAFMSMLGNSFLNEIVTARSLDGSGEILNKLRIKVKNSLNQTGQSDEQKDGMDIAFYIIDTETLELQFSGAYNPLYIIRKSKDPQGLPELIEFKANRQPIAVHIKEKPFDSQKLKLEKGDCLYSFSDGFPDQFGGKYGNKYKTKNFKQFLISISNEPMNIQKQKLENEFNNWKGTKFEQIDDVLVIGVKI